MLFAILPEVFSLMLHRELLLELGHVVCAGLTTADMQFISCNVPVKASRIEKPQQSTRQTSHLKMKKKTRAWAVEHTLVIALRMHEVRQTGDEVRSMRWLRR
jgi:hypothetical protein